MKERIKGKILYIRDPHCSNFNNWGKKLGRQYSEGVGGVGGRTTQGKQYQLPTCGLKEQKTRCR